MAMFFILFVGLSVVLLRWWVISEVILSAIERSRKSRRSKLVREGKNVITRSLGEVIKSHRTACGMTQEFVAEKVGGQQTGCFQMGNRFLGTQYL